MEKIDYRKKYKDLYTSPKGKVIEVDVPAMKFAMIDGAGVAEGPEASPEFQHAIGALYGLTYTLKMGRKKAGIGPDYTIGPLEGLWWMEDDGEFDMAKPDKWRWTMMIFQPEFITQAEFDEAVLALKKKKDNPSIDKLRFEEFVEGRSVQIMHIGPYAEEAPNIKKMADYAVENGLKQHGRHHEIYFGDPRRSAPEKLKTLLRHPVKPV